MYLHQNKTVFVRVITETSKRTGIPESLVEKDYYVFMLLKKIRQGCPDVMFKGGTSLYKGYGIINRFSEDLDLTLVPSNPMSEGQRRKFNHLIEDCFNALGLKLNNTMIRYKSDFVNFTSNYDVLFKNSSLTDYVKVESVLRRKGRVLDARYTVCKISNYIYDALIENKSNLDFLTKAELLPFEMYCYDVRYTLCEKLISIGNNYLRGKKERLSRHLYDVHKLLNIVSVNLDLRNTFLHVVECTQGRGFDDAIIKGNNLETAIYRAIVEDFYKEDYLEISSSFIFDNVTYEQAKQSIIFLLEVGLCDTLSNAPLRQFRIMSKEPNGDYIIRNMLNGSTGSFTKRNMLSYGLENSIQNYKFSSDGKLIKRFRGLG